jgi:hypothetical protein
MREVFCTGPLPPEGSQFCTICVINFKSVAVDLPDVQDEIQRLLRGDGAPVRFDLLKAVKGRVPAPEMAVGLALCPQFPGAMLPLCWAHVQGVKFTNIQPASEGQVPLLGRGR